MPSTHEIMESLETLFARVSKEADLVYRSLKLPCAKHCSLCCEQLFPVSLVEAYSVSVHFAALDRTSRRELQKKAEKISEKLSEKNWNQYQAFNIDKKTLFEKRADFAHALHNTRISCPLLVKNLCSVYSDRPHDCRVHGCSFDATTHELVACEKFNDRIKNQPNFYKKLMDFNFLYSELLTLDRNLLTTLTQNTISEKTMYVTSLYIPILHDFTQRNWFEFFEKKFSATGKLRSARFSEVPQYHFIVDIHD
ncbi:hypothetical protein HZA41_02095 [Candidatus Peregrinibacteria bacterium]|nr:hypothetical protein [Candidatus Peregrinibacteria bacterium]